MGNEYRYDTVNLLLRRCQSAFYWLFLICHFQEALRSERRKKLTKKTLSNRPHIDSCISIKEMYLLVPRLPFQKDRINQWNPLEQLSDNGTPRELSFEIKTTIQNQYFWIFLFPTEPVRHDGCRHTAGPAVSMSSPPWFRESVRKYQYYLPCFCSHDTQNCISYGCNIQLCGILLTPTDSLFLYLRNLGQ